MAVFVAAALILSAGVLLEWEWRSLLSAGIALFTATFLIAAASSFHHERELHGAIHLTIALLAAATAYATISAGGTAFIALLPVIITAIVLPFVRLHTLAWIIIGSWFAGAAIILVGNLWLPPARLPFWVDIGFRVIGYAALLALTLGLLYRHHRTLNEALNRARSESETIKETHRHLVESNRALQSTKEHLENTNRSLERTRQRLERSNRARTRFLNSAAHELHTPLTPIVIHLELMDQNPLTKADNQLRRSLDVIQRNVTRLKSHINDLVDVSRLESGREAFRFEHTPLKPMMQELEATFQESAHRRGVHLNIQKEDLPTVRADPSRIMQVLFNLVQNALQATDEGDRIRVTTRQTNDSCTVRVFDTGRGLTLEESERIFEPFTQSDGEKTFSRAGLGLYISRTIIENHGGRIGCQSPGPGRGSVFWFTLPLATQRLQRTPRKERQGPPIPPDPVDEAKEATQQHHP